MTISTKEGKMKNPIRFGEEKVERAQEIEGVADPKGKGFGI